MSSVNKVILIGNLGRDPEIKYTASGDAVANMAIATTENWKDKSGEKKEKTEWHRVVAFRKLAELAGEYLKKGRPVYIEGKLATREWTDKQNVKHYTTEIVADEIKFLGNRDSNGQDAGSFSSQGQFKAAKKPDYRQPANAGFEDMTDDIPF